MSAADRDRRPGPGLAPGLAPGPTSLLLANADLRTMQPATTPAQQGHRGATPTHLLAHDGRIVALGGAELLAHRHEVDEVVDAGGASVLPGFVDTHLHVGITGLGMLAIDVTNAPDLAAVAHRIRAGTAPDAPTGQLVVATGLDTTALAERRMPTAAELDVWAGSRPVYLMGVTGHESAVNTAAAARLAVETGGPPPPAGHLTGADNIAAFTHLWRVFADQVDVEVALRTALEDARRNGVTTVHALEPPERATVLRDPARRWPVRIRTYVESFDLDVARQLRSPGVGGCGAAALDGDVDAHTAALLAPYTDDPSTCGQLAYDDVEVARFVADAHAAGLQVALHCVGSGAIEQALRAMTSAVGPTPGDHRHRIEHFSLPEPGQAERAAAAGIAVGAQPAFNHLWPHHDGYPPLLGAERAGRVDPVRSLIDAGVRTGFGSDGPVTPRRPMLAVHAAVNHSNPAERIPVATALAAHTREAAWLGFDEQDLGVLAPGMSADLAVLDRPLAEVPDAELADVEVAATVIAGAVVWRATPAGP